MNRFALVLALLASCSSGSKKEPERRTEDPAPRIDSRTAEPSGTHELGTDRTRPGSKTIEWQNLSTPETATYLGGEIVIDRILREDAEDMYGVRVRLGNRAAQVHRLEYRIRFTDTKGAELMAVHATWRPALIEPRGVVEVSDACRLHGAAGFRLFVRRAGTSETGEPK